MSVRLMLAVSAGVIAGMLGMRGARRLRVEAARLRRWTVLLERLRLVLAQSALPLPDALDEAADGKCEPDMLMHELASGMRRNPLASLQDCFAAAAYHSAETAVLKPLMAQLDRWTVESRLLAIDHAHGCLLQLAADAQERAGRDAALWARLGWTAGACLTILLI